MRRMALYGIGWMAAAAVAVLLAWQGVGLVGRNVTESHPRALTADEARAALGQGSGPAGVGPETPGAEPAPAPPGGGGQSSGASRTTNPTTGTRPRSTAATAPSPSPSATSTPTPSTSPSTTRPPAPTPTTSAGVVRTYNLVGGSVALRFEPGKVTVVWANPNPGFRADIDDRDGGGVRVRFDGDSHRSQVEAWWDGGPQDRVEDGSGSSGGSGPG